MRFVGDHIGKFQPGEVVLLGENLPHMWLNDEIYFEGNEGIFSESYCLHFSRDFLGKEFWQTVCTSHIAKMLSNARKGIHFLNLDDKAKLAFKELQNVKHDFEKLVITLDLLHTLASHKDIRYLASDAYEFSVTSQQGDDSIKYILENFQNVIQLSDVAKIAGMNPAAFSRYFKRRHNKTFSYFLNEIRIGFASKLLIEQKHSISTVAYRSGFNSISNFNRQFRKIREMSPSEFLSLNLNLNL